MKHLFLFFIPFITIAQEQVTSKWSLKVNTSPDYAYRRLILNKKEEAFITTSPNDSISASKLIIDDRNKSEKSIISYTIFVSALYSITPSLYLETGIAHCKKGEAGTIKVVNINSDQTETVSDAKQCINYYFLEMPFKVSYYFINSTIKVYGSIGATPSLLLKFNTKIQEKGKEEVKLKQTAINYHHVNKFILNALVGIGIEKSITKSKWSILFQPELRYGLTPIANEIGIVEYLYSGGLMFGVRYKI